MINIERSEQVPLSLVDQKSYRGNDVLDELYKTFRGKCYLTEQVFTSSKEMEIDHFITQKEDGSLIYEWTNLYPIDNKANKQRAKTTPSGGYLDPCNPQDDVEKEIVYVIEFGGNSLFKPRDALNQKAVNTAQLLNHLHKDLKPNIRDKHHEVVNTVAEWHHARVAGNEREEHEKELLLRKLLSHDSHFTMLMRSIRVIPPHFLIDTGF